MSTSTLTPGQMKVKRLSSEVAVVHARMTLSGDQAAGDVTPPGPRSTIVSFVVHRSGDRWLCASAHNTDVIPLPETMADLPAREHAGGIAARGEAPA
jgi:hypothetical protein